MAECAILTKLLQFLGRQMRRSHWPFGYSCLPLMVSCSSTTNGWSLPTSIFEKDGYLNPYPIDYPAFTIAAEGVAAGRSSHFNYSLVVASYRLMLSHKIPLNENSIAKAVNYVVRAREIAGPRLLFGNGTRIINILHEYDSFNNLFAPAAVIRKEIGLGARAEDIWTFQGPAEIAPALKAIANSKGPTTIYVYAHGAGQRIRLSDVDLLDVSDLAKALKQRRDVWTNVLGDECDGVVTYLPSALQRLGVAVPSYILSSTPRGGMTRGSRLLNAISGTGTGSRAYFVDPSRLELEDLAKSQDFVLVWTPTQTQKRALERAWPFSSIAMSVDDTESYPEGVWELASYGVSSARRTPSVLAAASTI